MPPDLFINKTISRTRMSPIRSLMISSEVIDFVVFIVEIAFNVPSAPNTSKLSPLARREFLCNLSEVE